MSRRRWWMVLPAILVVLGLAGFVGLRGVQRARYGDVHDERSRSFTVDGRGRFTLAVPDRGASVGDHWTASVQPAGSVTLARSQLITGSVADRVLGPANGGGGGTRYFVYDAQRSGPTTITLHDCFQGCRDERTRAASHEVTWTVTVR